QCKPVPSRLLHARVVLGIDLLYANDPASVDSARASLGGHRTLPTKNIGNYFMTSTLSFGLALVAATLLVGVAADAADLPRSSPEAQGVSSAGILEFIEAADKNLDSLHSFMLVRHGHVVAECWWAPYHAA